MNQSHTETLVNNVKRICDSNPSPSFGRDSHVQQMAPGRQPETARKTKTDKTSKLATWNVCTLHQKGKLENFVKEMERMKLNILGLAQEIEQKLNIDSKFMHAKIKDVSGEEIKCSSPGCIKSKDGTMLMEKKEILNRWSEYVEDLLKDDRCKKPIIKKKIECPTILKEEVEAAIKKMKNGKATGPDNIPVEIVKALDNLGLDLTTKLLNTIFDGTIPEDVCKSVFVVLPKTPGATECKLHITISLMSHFTKILLRALMHRMRKSIRPEISPKQFGFMLDKRTRNAIFTLSMLMERCIEMQKDLHLCFIDYSKAFDKVRHVELFRMLEKFDIDGKDLRVIRNLYWDQTAAVRIEGEYSDFKPIRRGVRQGCVMSSDLFTLYSEIMLRNLDDISSLKINGENLNNLR
ncbi:endonuclease-reverse transcriptase [Plakobranchus ocellatus]|uniref:Endonuclease-reverse transcriptase n=1 Tax=Plakobranchus ocellatus TaxID=259542 RepID=A0AAV4D967_9GAST|nr:endonuclease-reverse transcriptase [Plakobranchus ocellatus]